MEPLARITKLSNKHIEYLLKKTHIPAHNLSVFYYSLLREGFLSMGFATFKAILLQGSSMMDKGHIPGIDSPYRDRMTYLFVVLLKDISDMTFAPIHYHIYQKALECPTGRFALDVIKTYDPSIKERIKEHAGEKDIDVNELTDKELEAILSDLKENKRLPVYDKSL